MNSLELEFARRTRNYSKEDMAKAIGKSLQSYSKKERGEVAFSDNEKITLTNAFALTFPQFNAIFFDGKLPKWNE